jgi:hypothetical protein
MRMKTSQMLGFELPMISELSALVGLGGDSRMAQQQHRQVRKRGLKREARVPEDLPEEEPAAKPAPDAGGA